MKKLLKPVLILLIVISTFGYSLNVFAKNTKNNLTNDELKEATKIANTENLSERKRIIKSELESNKSSVYKNYIATQIVVDEESSLKTENMFTKKNEVKAKNYTCLMVTGTKLTRNYFGNWLYRFNLLTNHCADYYKVYSGRVVSTWADIYSIGWGYYGLTTDRNFSYISATEFVASRQALFKLCINNNWSCAIESRPWIEIHGARQGRNSYQYTS